MAAGETSKLAGLTAAWRLRALDWALEAALILAVFGSVAAIGSVHPWAYVPLWFACLGIALLLALRALAIRSLRRILGPVRFSFHVSNRWITLDTEPAFGAAGWSFDLRQPASPWPPLLLPGLVFLGWILFQTAPLPAAALGLLSPGHPAARGDAWHPLTRFPADTWRGIAFVAAALVLHLAAAAAFNSREARERFARALAVLGTLLSFVGLLQFATGTKRIYGVFQPLEGDGAIFGPFVNRDHFAGYMLMLAPACLALLANAYRQYERRVGPRPNLRRWLISLGTRQGTSLFYAAVSVLATAGALIATTSRGALLAFGVSLCLALFGLRRGGVQGWALGLGFVVMALSWFGLERLESRFGRSLHDAPGRTLVWKDSLQRMDGLWLTGSGFNTFGPAMSHVTPWTLPRGASPWPAPLAQAVATGARIGVRVPEEIGGLAWYREAHNDYLQTLVETGVPGLLVTLWAALAVLAAARKDPWLLAALAGVLLHAVVEFGLQIPAIAVLFVVIAGTRPSERTKPDPDVIDR